jgi:hypothetical protein
MRRRTARLPDDGQAQRFDRAIVYGKFLIRDFPN